MVFHSRCGGVSYHAVARVQNQYHSSAAPEEIRKTLRREKNAAKIKNGFFQITEQGIKRLKIEMPIGKELFGLVTGGVVTTVKHDILK